MSAQSDFEVGFADREITAWGGMALMQKMLQSIQFSDAAKRWDLPQPGSNRGYEPVQIIEQFMVSIWCGANRFAHSPDCLAGARLQGTKPSYDSSTASIWRRTNKCKNKSIAGSLIA